MKQILQDFIATDLVVDYSAAYDIIYIDLVGSQRTGIVNDFSDFDIEIMVIDQSKSNLNQYHEKGHFMQYEDESHLHWYVHDLASILSSGSPYYMFIWSLGNFLRLKDLEGHSVSDIKFQPVLDLLNNNSRLLFEHSLNQYIKSDRILNELKNATLISKEHYSKNLYKCVTAWYVLNDREILDSDKVFLDELKRIQWLSDARVDSSEFQSLLAKALADIQSLITYFETFESSHFDIQIENLLIQYNEICNSIVSVV